MGRNTPRDEPAEALKMACAASDSGADEHPGRRDEAAGPFPVGPAPRRVTDHGERIWRAARRRSTS